MRAAWVRSPGLAADAGDGQIVRTIARGERLSYQGEFFSSLLPDGEASH